MGRPTNHKKKILELLKALTEKYPSQLIADHIFAAFVDFESLEGITDKEFLFNLEKYLAAKELDETIPHLTGEKELEKLYRDAENINAIFDEDEEEDY